MVGYNLAGLAFFVSGILTVYLMKTFAGSDDFTAKVGGNLVGLTINYFIERYWVFKRDNAQQRSKSESLRYWILSIANFWIDIANVMLLGYFFGFNVYIATVISSGFFTVWNFVWYKYWVFPEYKAKKRPPVNAKRKYA